MKTNRLILKNGLLTFLVSVSLSLNGFASVEANEITASSGAVKSHETKGLIAPVTVFREDVITETLKDWMESGLYWASIDAPEVENTEISEDMLQTKFTDKPSTLSEVRAELFNSLRTWMQNGFYWDKMDKY